VLVLVVCLFRPADIARSTPAAPLLYDSEHPSRIAEPSRHQATAAGAVRVRPLRISNPAGRHGTAIAGKGLSGFPLLGISGVTSRPAHDLTTRAIERRSGRSPPIPS